MSSGGLDGVTVTFSPQATVTEYDPTTGTAAVQTLQNVTSVPPIHRPIRSS